MLHSRNRRLLVAAVAVLCSAAVAVPLALAGGTPPATDAPEHSAPARHAAAPTWKAISDDAGNRCGTPGADPRTCTVPSSQTPPTFDGIDAARLAETGTVTVPVRVSGPGTVRVTGFVDDDEPAIEPASATASQAGTVDLTVVLKDGVRKQVAAGERIVLHVLVASSNSPISLATLVPLATP